MSSSSPPPGQPSPKSIFQYAKAWGESPLGPTLLATLITPLHFRPFQPLPMLFPPVLLFTSYLNIAGYKVDAAGTSAAWSALYVLLASRRRQRLMQRFGARGWIRGAAVGTALGNVIGGGIAWGFGRRGKEDV